MNKPAVERRNLRTGEPWPAGPWDDEPDELDFAYGDVRCRIVRHPHHGTLNGYVALPPSHPWYGKDMGDLEFIDVHGGITFTGYFGDAEYATGDGSGTWWVGFDTNHWRDFAPGMINLFDGMPDQPLSYMYRDLTYVRGQCELLATQAIAAMKG